MSEQERRVGKVYYTRTQARAGNPDIDPFHYDDAPEAEEEVSDNEQEQLLNQGAKSSVRAYGRSVRKFIGALALIGRPAGTRRRL
ncbi:hypothetical protein L7F22_059906 [Adiantum nelumboides]|nr:hypothetical protein [Adiantum nelumboides]